MVSELTNDHLSHQRAQAFSMLPLMYGLGSIIGPILGGFLSHPVTNYPNVFGNLGYVTDLLVEYPYLLPCFISAFICALGLIFGFFFLEETLVVKKSPEHEDEEEVVLIAESADNNYSTFENNSTGAVKRAKMQASPTPTLYDKKTTRYTLKDALTPLVLSVCITYGFFALQAVFMDGMYYVSHDANSSRSSF